MTFTGAVDRSTLAFWEITGRRVDLDGPEAWLRAPVHDGSEVADHWLEAYASTIGGTLAEGSPDAGLLPSMSLLDGPGFASGDLRPEVRDFYERTSRWRTDCDGCRDRLADEVTTHAARILEVGVEQALTELPV